MQLLAVRTARVLAFFNTEELNPAGRAIAHGYLKAFIERYSFIKYPQTSEDILDEENKGLNFELGKWKDFAITRLSLFSWGVVVETPASTDVSEGVLQDILDWGAEHFGLSNRPDLITRRAYVSELVFTSDMSLPAINPSLNEFGNKATDSLARNFRQKLQYEISGITFHFDATHSKQFFAPVHIKRFDDAPYYENKYYSGAPLPTKEHIAFLEEFEAALKG